MFSLSDVGRALALVSALTSVVSATPVPEPQRIVIPPAQNAWQARHGLTNANYQNTFNQLVAQGYRLNWVGLIAAVFGPFAPFALLSRKEEEDENLVKTCRSTLKWKVIADIYYQVSGYAINNDPRFAAIWEQTNNGVEWVARHGLDSAQYSTAFNQYANQGYRLKLVNAYVRITTAIPFLFTMPFLFSPLPLPQDQSTLLTLATDRQQPVALRRHLG
jgi:hypothetical protein